MAACHSGFSASFSGAGHVGSSVVQGDEMATTGDRDRIVKGALPTFARHLLCRSLVFLVRTARNNLERMIWQWPLQCLRLIPWRLHPYVALLIGRQDHRHGLGMDRRDDRLRW